MFNLGDAIAQAMKLKQPSQLSQNPVNPVVGPEAGVRMTGGQVQPSGASDPMEPTLGKVPTEFDMNSAIAKIEADRAKAKQKLADIEAQGVEMAKQFAELKKRKVRMAPTGGEALGGVGLALLAALLGDKKGRFASGMIQGFTQGKQGESQNAEQEYAQNKEAMLQQMQLLNQQRQGPYGELSDLTDQQKALYDAQYKSDSLKSIDDYRENTIQNKSLGYVSAFPNTLAGIAKSGIVPSEESLINMFRMYDEAASKAGMPVSPIPVEDRARTERANIESQIKAKTESRKWTGIMDRALSNLSSGVPMTRDVSGKLVATALEKMDIEDKQKYSELASRLWDKMGDATPKEKQIEALTSYEKASKNTKLANLILQGRKLAAQISLIGAQKNNVGKTSGGKPAKDTSLKDLEGSLSKVITGLNSKELGGVLDENDQIMRDEAIRVLNEISKKRTDAAGLGNGETKTIRGNVKVTKIK